MLLKVHNDTPINITNKSPIIKAKQEYKQEKILNKKILFKEKEIKFNE